MADASSIAKQVLQLLLSAGSGAASIRAGGMPGLVSAVSRAGGIGGAANAFMSKQYPTEFAPDSYHTYNVANIPGPANLNSYGRAARPTIEKAGRMQTLAEHNKAITQYLRPGMDLRQQREALRMGMEAEKRLPAFWNESKTRDHSQFQVSSSAVSGIRLTPDGRIEVQWHTSPKWYTFKSYPDTYTASLAAQKLLMSDSIGRDVYPVISHPPKKGAGKLGNWNRTNYDAPFA